MFLPSFLFRSSDPVHAGENLFSLTVDGHADLLAYFCQLFRHIIKGLLGPGNIYDHHHIEILLQNGLSDIQNVYVILRQIIAGLCYDANSVLSDNSDDNFAHNCVLLFSVACVLIFHNSDKSMGTGSLRTMCLRNLGTHYIKKV